MNSQNSNQYQPNQQLNQSRFLLQQINLQQQPTQQQILERAQQLQIDDLVLAKESLTKQLDPQWKPYCNRYREIYYINLLEKLAYIDHPIDIYFKKQYAKINQLPIPRFKCFRIQEIATSMGLIQEQIKNLKTGSYKTTLKIVYEQPSEQQAVSSHPKSPSNYPQQNSMSNYFKQNQLTSDQLQQLYAYQRQIQQKFQEQYLKKKSQLDKKLKNKTAQHDKSIKLIKQRKITQICQQFQQQLKRKNQLDIQKQQQKLQLQYSNKRLEYCQNIHNFNILFQNFRNKIRSIQNIYQDQHMSEKTMIINNMKHKSQLERNRKIQNIRDKIIKQFNQKTILLVGNSSNYQQNLKKSLQKAYSQLNYLQNKSKRNENYPVQRKKIFGNNNKIQDQNYITVLKKDNEYQQLKKQINQLYLWSDEQSKQNPINNYYKPSLSLRLRMKLI